MKEGYMLVRQARDADEVLDLVNAMVRQELRSDVLFFNPTVESAVVQEIKRGLSPSDRYDVVKVTVEVVASAQRVSDGYEGSVG